MKKRHGRTVGWLHQPKNVIRVGQAQVTHTSVSKISLAAAAMKQLVDLVMLFLSLSFSGGADAHEGERDKAKIASGA
jgi:hypothetical protein